MSYLDTYYPISACGKHNSVLKSDLVTVFQTNLYRG